MICCNLFFLVILFIDQFEDQFEKRSKEKEERIAKNEYQRLRNLARNKKGKVKGVGHIILNLLKLLINILFSVYSSF